MTVLSFSKITYPPGPTGLASLQVLQQLRHNPLTVLHDLSRAYGDMAHIGVGPYHIYLLNHPDLLHEILVNQAAIMHKPRTLSRPIAEFLGSGLLISHGDYWKQQRRLIQPAFQHRSVDGYGQLIADCIIQEINQWVDGCVYDIDDEFMKLTLRMVMQTLFSADSDDTADDIAHAVKVLQYIAYKQGQSPVTIPAWIPLPAHMTKQRAIRLLNSLVARIVQNGRESGTKSNNLLTLLFNAVDVNGQALSHQQICDEVMTVLLAGHESTANGIAWMWYLLAQHPPVAAKLRAELDSVLGNRLPTPTDLERLPYNAMIVKEALRLYPPAWALPREPVQDTMIGGYPIRKGSLLLGVPYLIQRDSRYYENPDAFIPERFANNAERHLPRHVYLPFGGGPRYCVGNTFALLAMQLTLAAVHQRFDLTLVPDQQIVLDPLLTLRPRNGIYMRVTAIK